MQHHDKPTCLLYTYTYIYIRPKAIHLIRVHNLHFITTTALYILHIMCFPLVSATWFPLYKTQETIYHFALQLILCRHCIFFVQEEERDICRLRKTLLCFDASNSSHFLLIFLLKPQNLASTYITYILHLLRTICFSAETIEIKITLVDDMFSVCI